MSDIPKKIFIIPYRDRVPDKTLFIYYMKHILEDEKGTYKFFFIHQDDKRQFNRGAIKNIGFLYVKETYPNNYKDITLIFHDIDTIPYKKDIFDYDTVKGVVKHFYGFKYALGGMFAIKGSDFELTKGFPNFWSWGYEDNALKDRWDKVSGGKYDYSQFLDILDKNVLYLFHGYGKDISKTTNKIYHENKKWNRLDDGFHKVTNLTYNSEEVEENITMVNVKSFLVPIKEEDTDIIKDNVINMSIRSQRRKNRINRPFLM